MKQKFDVMGMTCASCQAHVNKSVAKLAGVSDVNVNLLAENMEVDYDESKLSAKDIIEAVQKGGYDAKVAASEETSKTDVTQDIEAHNERKSKELKQQFHKLVLSFVFTVPLFYLSMGSMMGWPGIPSIFLGHQNMMIFALTELLLCLIVLSINAKYFIGGFKSLFHLAPNMDSLIAIGSGASTVYSLYAVYMMAYYLGRGNMKMAHMYHMNLYFESAAMIVTLISLGKYFEARSKKRTSDAINGLIDLAPEEATVLDNGEEKTVSIGEIRVGDQVVVKSGESIPVDGVIVSGVTSVDESMITGESIPVDKKEGDLVIGSTINKSGRIIVETKKTNDQSTLSQIIALVEEAGNSKAPIARLADVIAGYFVPAVITIAVVVTIVWLFTGVSFKFALNNGIAVLVISCPCALGLATPTAIMVGTGRGAKLGILFKDAETLENTSKIDTIVFDKTGTLTYGQPQVTDVEINDERFINYALSLEMNSSHPLAKAISSYKEINPLTVTDYQEIPGGGLSGKIMGSEILAGNARLMEEHGVQLFDHEDYAKEGKTVIYFAIDGQYAGLMALADQIKAESKDVITALKAKGIHTLMLTGDNKVTATAIANKLGMDVKAEVLPADKEAVVRSLQEEGHNVAMVGDGINDAPALTRADIGVSFTSGLDIAIDSADIVLMKNNLKDLVNAIDLSHATIKNIKENLFWALFYNVICIPVAAGAFYPAFGWQLSPMLGAFAMSFSSVFVVSNALRLRFFKPQFNEETSVYEEVKHSANVKTTNYQATGDKNKENKKKEKMQMSLSKENCEKVVSIEGMMCEHCVAHVTKALKDLNGEDALVSLENKEAYITGPASDEDIKKAVADAGYEVTGISTNKAYDKVLVVPDMMCQNCVKHVTNALDGIDGVTANVSLDDHKAYVTLSKPVDDETLKKAVADAGYSVESIA